jgi:hypothetical protein
LKKSSVSNQKERSMKKKYIEPQMEPAAVDMFQSLLAGSVRDGDAINDVYDQEDVTYSRENFWSDEED